MRELYGSMKMGMRLLFVIVLFAFCVSELSAQQTPPPVKKKQLPKKTEVVKTETAAVKQEVPVRSEIQGKPLIIGLAGGYFIPLDDAGTILDPSWSARLFMQKNNVEDTLFGIGLDLTYAKSPDNTIDGAVTYGSIIPYITSTFKTFYEINAQIKTGAGFTVIVSDMNGSVNGDLSLTLNAGGGFFRFFGAHFFTGFEVNYYYYFMIHSTSAVGTNLYAGYRF